jgi:putative ABC transport system permease protein
MGTGSAVTALAAVIIGFSLLKKMNVSMSGIAISGAILYKGILVFVLRFGLDPNDFKLATAVAVIVAMGFSSGAFKYKKKTVKKAISSEGGESYAEDRRLVKNL